MRCQSSVTNHSFYKTRKDEYVANKYIFPFAIFLGGGIMLLFLIYFFFISRDRSVLGIVIFFLIIYIVQFYFCALNLLNIRMVTLSDRLITFQDKIIKYDQVQSIKEIFFLRIEIRYKEQGKIRKVSIPSRIGFNDWRHWPAPSILLVSLRNEVFDEM